MRKFGAGIIALLVKLGPKIVSVLGKLFKTLKVGKVALAGASVASYAYMFTWQFALIIIFFLFVHESGHIWAMKRRGIKTKGIYFIPFVGGAAVAESEFPSRGAETFVALMGPLWGFGLMIISGCVYFATKNPLFAAAAGWMGLVSLINLLPINPLDGGRVMKSISYSIHTKLGLIFMGIGLGMGAFLMIYAKIYIFLILLFVGGLELIIEYKRRQTNHPVMSPKWVVVSFLSYAFLAVALWGLMHFMSVVPGAALAMEALRG